MAFDATPWFIGGGAQHSPEVARLLAYVASNGREGVVEPGDLKVTALPTPGTSVRINIGAAMVLNRSGGSVQRQSYAVRNETATDVPVAATGSSSGRSDLVVVRVEDPQYSPWPVPPDPVAATYVKPHIIQGVPSTTRSATELGLGYSALALARLDLPASTGTVTNAMIVDLRQEISPVTTVDPIFSYYPPNNGTLQELTASDYVVWPTGAQWSVNIPEWAVRMEALGIIAGVAHYGGVGDYFVGGLRVTLAGTPAQYRIYSGTSELDGIYKHRQDYVIPGSINIGASLRGTSQTVNIQGARTGYSGIGRLVADYQTSAMLQITWISGTS